MIMIAKQTDFSNVLGRMTEQISFGRGNCGTCAVACKCDISRPTCSCGWRHYSASKKEEVLDFFKI